jgi:Rps23 Pro-64 3,4-dihydroxylase Tpa1-like proline 4-hydroxylase
MDFIYTNNNSLSKELCDDIIELYERDKRFAGKGQTITGVNSHIKDSMDLPISQIMELKECIEWKNIHKLLCSELYANLKKYIKNISKDEYNKYHIEPNHKFAIINANPLKAETFQVQKYEPSLGRYIYHHDGRVQIHDKRYRMITYLWYLNDVEEGGETEFWCTFKVKPEAGKLILFPATWTYPHCANIPISNAKYIITGWLYADANS